MPTYTSLQGQQRYLVQCSDCPGFLILAEMTAEHTAWHQLRGDLVDLSGLGGANDVPPLPEREA